MIAGKAGVGKTTIAGTIAAEAFKLGLVPVLLSFAGPLKKDAKERGYDKKEFPDKYRAYCQDIGEAMRELDDDHWVKLMHGSIQEVLIEEQLHIDNNDKFWERCVIIDDCRYVNEIAYGMSEDAVRIFISSGKRKLCDSEWRKHGSEALANLIESGKGHGIEYRDLFNHIIYNDSTKGNLDERLKEMVPIWCGTKVGKGERGLMCGCEGCRAKRSGKTPFSETLFGELMDLIDLDEEWLHDETEEDFD
jgi:hypothetical protein